MVSGKTEHAVKFPSAACLKLSSKINRFKFVFAVFAREIVKRYAPVSQNFPNAKSSFFAAFARHHFGAENDRHLRSRPDVRRRGGFSRAFFKKAHLDFGVFRFLMFDFAPRRISLFVRLVFAEFLARRRGRFTNRIENGTFRFFLFSWHKNYKSFDGEPTLTSQKLLTLTTATENFTIKDTFLPVISAN